MQLVKAANKSYNAYKQTEQFKSKTLRDSMNDLYNTLSRLVVSDTFLDLVQLSNEAQEFLETRDLLRRESEEYVRYSSNHVGHDLR